MSIKHRRGFELAIILAALSASAFLILSPPAHAGANVVAVPMTDEGFASCAGGACVWGHLGQGLGKVIEVPQPITTEEREAAAKRDRAWIERCHPVIEPDRYGVARYHYSAAGCEFGR